MNDTLLVAGFGDVPDIDAETTVPPPPARVEDDSWFPLIKDAADLVTEQLPPIVEIVTGIVAEQSKLVIGSGSKSFKTWLTMDMALSISHGVLFLGRKTTRRRVLYVNLELKPADVHAAATGHRQGQRNHD